MSRRLIDAAPRCDRERASRSLDQRYRLERHRQAMAKAHARGRALGNLVVVVLSLLACLMAAHALHADQQQMQQLQQLR